MKFAAFFTFASLSSLALSTDFDTLHADGKALADIDTALGTQVAAFPTTPGSGTIFPVLEIVATLSKVVAAKGTLIADAVNLASPVSKANSLALVEFLTPVGDDYITTLRALQARKAAIAAIPRSLEVDALVLIQQELAVVKTMSYALEAAIAQYALTGAALDGWNALADRVIDEEIATITCYNSD
ncbi:hypothetical protein DXG01_014328 [Tephrocybe rancida]|nr:hypothetical protein DXG01_014328 [Tephrocybe rancida]